MNPKETTCRWCGKRVLFVETDRGKVCVEARFTPFKRTDRPTGSMFRADGARIPCIELREEQAEEADGYAHRYHLCPKAPGSRPRPQSKAEKWRASREE